MTSLFLYLPIELKERILYRVYNINCYLAALSPKPLQNLFRMFWEYKNQMASCIVVKWLVWVGRRKMYPQNLKLVSDEIYLRFQNSIIKTYDLIFQNSISPFLEEKTWDWWKIDEKLNKIFKRLLKVSRESIEEHIIKYHADESPLNFHERQLLIQTYNFPSKNFPSKESICNKCGLFMEDNIVRYPCLHEYCLKCFISSVKENNKRCIAYNIEEKQTCQGSLKRKGWNFYIRKFHLLKEEFHPCSKCGYLTRRDRICLDCISTLHK
jgi:hypothetical protein